MTIEIRLQHRLCCGKSMANHYPVPKA